MGCISVFFRRILLFIISLLGSRNRIVENDSIDSMTRSDPAADTQSEQPSKNHLRMANFNGVTTIRANGILLDDNMQPDVKAIAKLANANNVALYIVAIVSDDTMEKHVRDTFKAHNLFTSTFTPEQLLFAETHEAEKSIARALSSQKHVTNDEAVTTDLSRFVPAIVHVGRLTQAVPRDNITVVQSLTELL
ncbi:hypothetical protein J8273_0952 [Carpediemonas membranifera]|uniref:Uncharacterized protein n=1 Tax=Carpediemonas membranifera TaxID=201153 RepID=A0A8J6AXR8_9EUKA|nr:hypothetical protein J8273_0952 [Carpediemonas membranifera]|eukprot:KAG9397456.1 hypothetical protein J8273_0952 [Carpediemonas membranifera]